MTHRHLTSTTWNLMTIESLFEDGKLEDWQELGRAMRQDQRVAQAVLSVCGGPVDPGARALARVLVAKLYPGLAAQD